jgi:hypothetical protein
LLLLKIFFFVMFFSIYIFCLCLQSINVYFIFKSVQIPYKFNISSWKMIKILNHHQKIIFHILWFYYNSSYNFSSYIMYIITHLYVVKDSWSFEILKQLWNITWIFKVLEFHIFKNMNVFLVWLICSYHLYFFQWTFFYYMSPFDSLLQNWFHLT